MIIINYSMCLCLNSLNVHNKFSLKWYLKFSNYKKNISHFASHLPNDSMRTVIIHPDQAEYGDWGPRLCLAPLSGSSYSTANGIKIAWMKYKSIMECLYCIIKYTIYNMYIRWRKASLFKFKLKVSKVETL